MASCLTVSTHSTGEAQTAGRNALGQKADVLIYVVILRPEMRSSFDILIQSTAFRNRSFATLKQVPPTPKKTRNQTGDA